MAGSNAGFDAAAFRTAIQFAMTMGMPEDAGEQGIFRWNPVPVAPWDPTGADTNNLPLDWAAEADSVTEHDPVTVPIAVEFTPAKGDGTAMGRFDAGTVLITVLDADYADIIGANEVEFADAVYDIKFVAPPLGLFDVTIYQIYAQARDES